MSMVARRSWIPRIGDLVITALGPGEIIGIASANPAGHGWVWDDYVYAHGPYMVKLDGDGIHDYGITGFTFDDLRRAA